MEAANITKSPEDEHKLVVFDKHFHITKPLIGPYERVLKSISKY